MSPTPEYTMRISLNVLRHLGIGLYSNVPAVLSELVANAWDADSPTVDICVNAADGIIEVTDTGCGMTRDDLNDRFLNVRYQRRGDGENTSGGRPVMGRKGVGKLSAFSIARIVEVHTVKDGQRNAFRMDRQNIEASVRGNRTDEYHPDPIKPVIDGQQSGTRLVLRELNQSLNRAVPHLRRRLARRFSIIGAEHNFEVTVNGEQISPVHRDFHKKLEFVWHFGDRGKAMAEAAGPLMAQKEIGSVVEVKLEDGSTSQHEISGWIGTVNKPDDIDTVNSAMVVMARGKLIHEDLLPEFKEAGVYADYVLGEINADFLDTDEDDIITSGRQSVQEDAPRFRAIVEFVRKAHFIHHGIALTF